MGLVTSVCGAPGFYIDDAPASTAIFFDNMLRSAIFRDFRRQRDMTALAAGTMMLVIAEGRKEALRDKSAEPTVREIAETIPFLKLDTFFGHLDLSGALVLSNGCFLMQLQDKPAVVYAPNSDLQIEELVFPAPSWEVLRCTISAEIRFAWGFDAAGNCGACPEGQVAYWNESVHRRICRSCTAGRTLLQENAYNRMCFVTCPDTQVPDADGGACEDCPAGYFADHDRSVPACTGCPWGTSSVAGSKNCSLCPMGKYQPHEECGTTCRQCPIGSATTMNGSFKCLRCENGFSAQTEGMSECKRCGVGRVSSPDRGSCETCPAGRYSHVGGDACTDCPVGRYQRSPGQTECVRDSACCESPLPGLAEPYNKAGYYTLDTRTVEACKIATACLQNSTCEEGSTGRQCFSCLPGYYADPRCTKCYPLWLNISLHVLFLLAIVIIYQVLVVVGNRTEKNPNNMSMCIVKLSYNHFFQMSILARAVHVFSITDKSKYNADINDITKAALLVINMFSPDGLPNTESFWQSTSCLMQPQLTDAEQRHMDLLKNARHGEFYSAELADARATFERYQSTVEVRTLIFWNVMPFVLVFLGLWLNYIKVYRFMLKQNKLWAQAPRLFTQLFFFRWQEVSGMHEPANVVGLVQAYNKKIWGMYWPVNHVHAWGKQHMCCARSKTAECGGLLHRLMGFVRFQYRRISLRKFWRESLPVRMLFFWCLCVPIARKCLRPNNCITLDSGEAHQSKLVSVIERGVMLHEGSLECTWKDPLLWLSICLAALWALVLPAMFLFSLRSALRTNQAAVRAHAILVTGYRRNYWWWESVVFLRKIALLLLDCIEMQPAPKFFFFANIGFACLGLHTSLHPYDLAQAQDVQSLERDQLLIFTGLSLLMMLPGASLNFVFLVASFVHTAYVLWLLFRMTYHVAMNYADTLDEEKVNAMAEGFMKRNKVRLLRWLAQSRRAQAYVSYDLLHGFVTVVGNRGDQAVPPYVPRGRDFSTIERPKGKAHLSEVPGTPVLKELDDVRPATKQVKRMVQSLVMETVKKLATERTGHSFSVTCVDFVFRSAFSLVATQRRQQQKQDVAVQACEEVDRFILAKANKAGDPVMLTTKPAWDQEDEDDVDPMLTPAEVELAKTCREIQKDLRQNQHHIIQSFGESHRCRIIHRRAAREGRSITEKDFEGDFGEEDKLSEASSDEEEYMTGTASRGAILPAEDAAIIEERVMSEVAQMFSPALFRRGMTLRDLETGLYALTEMRPEEVTMKLNMFERMWLAEKINADNKLLYDCGAMKESETQFSATELIESEEFGEENMQGNRGRGHLPRLAKAPRGLAKASRSASTSRA
eukprot:TRINITY_DN5334_c0_g1_i1.p1 TRINITY_DN5334_c0_g1~~TRINITY_DN5334_c0_g1_i1.p1  ORF type:complete len:1548 (+),score=265.11 TRINITY_DN5334_c0_g1_i1:639-4646(+)